MPRLKKPAIPKWQKACILVLLAVTYVWFTVEGPKLKQQPTQANHNRSSQLSKLVQSRASGVMVEISGRIYKILNDDLLGSRHQRFLVSVQGNSVLIAHNIDLAPRVPITVNDVVRIKGEYEWNDKGGVIHWTHHDPQKKHQDGWIEHSGKKFK